MRLDKTRKCAKLNSRGGKSKASQEPYQKKSDRKRQKPKSAKRSERGYIYKICMATFPSKNKDRKLLNRS